MHHQISQLVITSQEQIDKKVDVGFIVATNRNRQQEVEVGTTGRICILD